LLIPTDEMFESISNGVALNALRSQAAAAGMRSLRIDGLDKVKAGITTLEEIYRVTA
jgi:general secretion pathway protein E